MQMATKRASLRAGIGLAIGVAAWPAWANASKSAGCQGVLAATWQTKLGFTAGLVQVLVDARQGLIWRVMSQIALPTRGHGLALSPSGDVLISARRPGDWLLRWQPFADASRGGYQTHAQWHWLSGDMRLNGHVLELPRTDSAAAVVLTTETDSGSGEGFVVVRSAPSLQPLHRWPTGGCDPHELLVLPSALGALPAGTVMVANGGIATQTELGRHKLALDVMDASLVAMCPNTGCLLQRWTLADRRLSIRHVAWSSTTKRLGVALQAQHGTALARASSPVFAVCDGVTLNISSAQADGMSQGMQGYGASVCGDGGSGFWVTSPIANKLARFDTKAHRLHATPAFIDMPQVCAVALSNMGSQCMPLTAGGSAIRVGNTLATAVGAQAQDVVQFDNHWHIVTC